MSDDDQYREYGSSGRDRETPGYLRSMINAFSGTGGETRPTLTIEEDESSLGENSKANEVPTRPTSSQLNSGSSEEKVKSSKSRVTDEKSPRDNSLESSDRISNSRPDFYDYDTYGQGYIPHQTDFRGRLISTVGHVPDPRPNVFGGFSLQREESSGRENFTGGNHSVRRSIGSIHNVTIRKSKRPKDRPQDRDYRRSSFPTAIQLPLLPPVLSRATDTTPEPESAGEYAWQEHGFLHSESRVGRGQQHPPGTKMASSRMGDPAGPVDEVFSIWLVFQGNSVQRTVWRSMKVSELISDTSVLFHLEPATIVLVLFSMHPVTLDKTKTLAGPPAVPHNAKIMVFRIVAPSGQSPPIQGFIDYAQARVSTIPLTPGYHPPTPYAKLLGSLKLPKFDGSAKNWKIWFPSFLGITRT
jgi:hypothetical protein